MISKSTAYEEAIGMLPIDLRPVFLELLEHYKFAALKYHGKQWSSPLVIAELVLMGWRNTEDARDAINAVIKI